MTPPDHTQTEIFDRLARERPVPAPGFRAELRRRLLDGASREAPAAVRRLIYACAGAGIAMLLIAAFGAAGVGPLAP